MGKKRKASGRVAEPKGSGELDPAEARLGPISTFEDVANSEDEHFLNRDKIMLDDEPGSKRRKREDETLELSDEEIFGYQDSDSDSDDSDDPGKSTKASGNALDEDGAEEEGQESGWWGSSKQAYYNADNIETEADALEEEAEAKRLQQKKLSKMKEEDFVFDGDEWLAGESDAEENDETVTEVLKDIDITDEMGPEEMSKLLATRYPEFGFLVDEFQELHPVLASLEVQARSKPGPTLEAAKYWVLGCYVAALASYLAVLTSPARDGAKVQKPLAPSELRDHDVMDTLMSCRKAWEKVKHVKRLGQAGHLPPSEMEIDVDGVDTTREQVEKLEKKAQKKKDKAAVAKQARKLARAKAIEDDVADLYDLPLGAGKPGKREEISVQHDDDNSDFGEEDALDARAAADKAARRKSLKFYTSQIVQKASRRAGAGRDAGGDMDIPHRERLRDRQARLVAEAEKRGKKGSKHGADLGDDSDEEDGKTANAIREDEDGYYDMVAHSAKNKRDDKAARYAAYAAASKADRVVENEEIGEDGKRKVTYAIEKNKGLTPKRSKDVRNPRVKRRKQYDAKQKKLRSMRPVWKGGEPKGGYRGELAGINTAVIKSTKL
ncbi:sas10/Utp3/C1D family protein [Hirsutella rhossiliensis]|uniref:Sas10/Utp3/C1D family domain-containing protein n=1 Tax=Hirsutella rhossiliensis TaxID=111463 RepID=A0A9P8SFM0_9HYPO|nr:sas10/Utp3/C1D family domain-containing protein [Hirsutella rhossiliensis]KAH0959151.1 sas10/Utp3/C1D family domain-containing protein [Hirsutella rhossiliensis]